MSNHILSVNRLSIRYSNHIAVNDVSLSLGQGDRFCLVGESGSGKTSVALAVSRLLPASATRTGQVDVNGLDLYELSSVQLQKLRRKDISLIFQDAAGSLIPGTTVGRQFLRVLRHRTGVENKKELNEIASEHLDRVGLYDHSRILKSYPSQLSGGMCQRIMIAMALCVRPSLVIADEPTSALDVLTQRKILDLLMQLQDELKFALLFITHDLRIASHYSDRVGVMQEGYLVESGPTKEVFTHGKHDYTRQLVDSAKQLSV